MFIRLRRKPRALPVGLHEAIRLADNVHLTSSFHNRYHFLNEEGCRLAASKITKERVMTIDPLEYS
jgi:hypothetical protein